jgi:ribosomal protein S28E/S33
VKYLVSVVGCTAVTGRILRVEKQFRKNKDLKRLVEEIIEKMQ